MNKIKFLIMATVLAVSATPVLAAKKKQPEKNTPSILEQQMAVPVLATVQPQNFDFNFHGELVNALQKLKEIQPDLIIGKAQGKSKPVLVDVSLAGVTTYDALKFLAEQSGEFADLVWDGKVVFVRYRAMPVKGTDAVKQQARKWQAGEKADPVMSPEGALLFPFGQGQPEVVCAPLRACSIQLQPGEAINNVILGDTVRWLTAPAKTGEGPGVAPHVIVKPTEKGLQTNLLVTTNRRTYVMTLRSSETNYTSMVGFYYPYDIVQTWQRDLEVAQAKADEENERKISDIPIATVDQLNLDSYEVRGDADLAWYPTRIFDDGTHVWIQMSERMESAEAPALVILNSKGDSQLVNYRVKKAKQGSKQVTYYIVDKIFDKAALILGVGGDQQKLEIVRK
jgi:P-type conjugative transfer protein TrbG